MRKTILILAANPIGTTPVRLGEEVREIEIGLERSRQREQFILEQRWAVTSKEIIQAMLTINPQIVHFLGHGEEEGLVFEDESGYAKLINGATLANLFELFVDSLECVVLNGCYTYLQAKEITKHIAYVISMDKAIGDKAAIEYAAGFYSALGSGKSYEFAHKIGCVAIRLAGITEQLTPQLLIRKDVRMPAKDDIQLNGNQRKEFREAILNAYQEEEIKMMLATNLELNYDAIVQGTTYLFKVFYLIDYFERRGQILDLLEATCKERPHNLKLQNFYKSVIFN
ncbi:effector-associated domain EAD1-containing protein [Scytonema sp. UIC 10036]|uniref:effector-associated domain EAD1-containing protein n=1 Tax=Scytonema sp. UIC 10036 TaxID=2304196 RepID=UPI001A9B4F4D|nr:effector-associated domain EAD1-containing protein [Scytonema sp. UIC 10036]